ncbi:hypothetical protein D9758_005105 [Tetrapyrgos nigripes]|uniref:Uncharacterized protein n=1 Tax=Tetrapyrgos nigripes TaxID=182062 RepID=A0A8H5GVY3_9AGAR|nr:hypothetical protein D9758_005105 [Tetrapyrgos nigripes]
MDTAPDNASVSGNANSVQQQPKRSAGQTVCLALDSCAAKIALTGGTSYAFGSTWSRLRPSQFVFDNPPPQALVGSSLSQPSGNAQRVRELFQKSRLNVFRNANQVGMIFASGAAFAIILFIPDMTDWVRILCIVLELWFELL